MNGEMTFFSAVASLSDVILAWGWLLVLFLAMWVAWETYKLIKYIDYGSSMQWTFFQVTVPEDSIQTPKAIENAIEVWGGIHKDPDVVEKFFEGYMLPWYSCEIQCRKDMVRYIMVVPTAHAKFFEGVVYGQYPTAEVKEVEDYTQEYTYQEMEKTFDMYGTEVVLVKDDIYPIRTYREWEDALMEDERFVDPHQALIEAYSNVGEGEQFWVQIMIKPVGADVINAWAEKGQEKIAEIGGEKIEKPLSLMSKLGGVVMALPGEIFRAALLGPGAGAESKDEKPAFRFSNPAQDAEMKGILQKVARTGFKAKIRLIYIAPAGKLNKPNISKAIGAFKQFNSFHLNSFKPDPSTKTNGPNYFLKASRRRFRKRIILLNYQWRDFTGDASGQMMTAEELATIYHFPTIYIKAPVVQRASAGLSSPPDNLPYV